MKTEQISKALTTIKHYQDISVELEKLERKEVKIDGTYANFTITTDLKSIRVHIPRDIFLNVLNQITRVFREQELLMRLKVEKL